MSRLLAWLRFRGWRNRYWREDWYHKLCDHSGVRWTVAATSSNTNDSIVMCADCGAVL